MDVWRTDSSPESEVFILAVFREFTYFVMKRATSFEKEIPEKMAWNRRRIYCFPPARFLSLTPFFKNFFNSAGQESEEANDLDL